MDFGEELKKLREAKGMTVNQLAMYSDISAATISRIENGKRGIPRPDNIKKLAAALKVPYEDLMEKAGYLTREEVFKTALSKGHLGRNDGFDDNEEDVEVKRAFLKQFLNNPDEILNNVPEESKRAFFDEVFTEEYSDFWSEMVRLTLVSKGIDPDKTKEIINELGSLSDSEVDDVIDFIKYKKSKSKGK